MSCSVCNFANIQVHKPHDLKNAIRAASNGIDEGKLEYLGIGDWGSSFKELSTRYEWSDFVHNYFRCTTCKQLFKLWAETYHGRGGALEPVDKVEGKITVEKL